MEGAYDYANARIRGLRGRLLKDTEIASLATRHDLNELLAGLMSTDYASDIERSSLQTVGLQLVELALLGNFCRRLQALRHFFQDAAEPGELVDILLGQHDAHNLVAVLRGKAAGASADAIQSGLVPAGALSEQRLLDLARATDLDAYIRQLRGLPLDVSGIGDVPWTVQTLEVAIKQAFLDRGQRRLRKGGRNAAMLLELLKLEADGANLLAVLRLVHRGLHQSGPTIDALLLRGGNVDIRKLGEMAQQARAGEAIATLGRPWQRILAPALGNTTAPDDAVAVEWAIESYITRWSEAQIFRDPMGLAVAIAYQAAKAEEIRKLRVVARAVAGRWRVDRLRQIMARGVATMVQWQTS